MRVVERSRPHPAVGDSLSGRVRVGAFGVNFRLDDTRDVITKKARLLCDEMPLCLEYLDRTFSQAGYLAEMVDGYHVRRLEVSLAFERG